MNASMPGRRNTQTIRGGKDTVKQSPGELVRGPRQVPSGGAKLPGPGFANAQTRGPRGNRA